MNKTIAILDYGAGNLTEAVIPAGVERIESDAFQRRFRCAGKKST